MPKFEYLRVTCTIAKPVVPATNTDPCAQSQAWDEAVTNWLNDLGEDGWELVGLCESHYVFMRERHHHALFGAGAGGVEAAGAQA